MAVAALNMKMLDKRKETLLQDMFNRTDKNESGKITFQDFVETMKFYDIKVSYITFYHKKVG